jgi:hypothetical protein
MTRRKTITLFILAVLAVASGPLTSREAARACDPSGPDLPYSISRETTYLTEPLREDGTVDYVAAVDAKYSQGVTPENNAFPLLLEAFGERILPEDSPAREAATEAIGATLPEDDGLFIRLPHSYRSRDVITLWDDRDMALSGPWDVDQAPRLAEWLESNAPALELIEQATLREHFYFPLIAAQGNPFVHYTATDSRGRAVPPRETSWPLGSNMGILMPMRQAARAFVCRAHLRIQQEAIEPAWADILAARGVGMMVDGTPFLMRKILALDCINTANVPAMRLLEEADISLQEARAFLTDWKGLPSPAPLANCIDTDERIFALDVLCWAAANPEDYRRLTATTIYGLASLVSGSAIRDEDDATIHWYDLENAVAVVALMQKADWDEVLRAFNREHDAIAEALTLPSRERTEALEKIQAAGQALEDRADELPIYSETMPQQLATDWTIAALHWDPHIVNLSQVADIYDRHIAQHELVSIALALTIHERENGHFPQRLDALVPEYLDEVGDDPFSGVAYRYQQADGGYVIYSVGMDLEDDGGDEDDDIVIRRLPRESRNGD